MKSELAIILSLFLLFDISHGFIGAQKKLANAHSKRLSSTSELHSEQNKPSKWATKIQETVGTRNLDSVSVSHILVQSEEMASLLLRRIQSGDNFFKLAQSVTSCEATRSKGGLIGWMKPDDSHLDDIINRELREEIFFTCYKPGDVNVIKSPRGYHIVKTEDTMSRLSISSRKRDKLPGTGIFQKPFSYVSNATSYWIETMGCQMNVADSERMEGQLIDLGLKKADTKEKADVVVLNTCSIRDHAEQKVYSFVGRHATRKHKGEAMAIVVAGCVAQQEGEQLIRRIPEIDLVMGPQYSNRIAELMENVMDGYQVVATDPSLIMEDVSRPRRNSDISAWVNIIYGCNEHCTYCVVPGTRGVEQSRPRESIRAEIEGLAQEGYREVTLLGQNIDAYGRDMNPKQTFASLLHYLSDIEGIERIRYVTSHPRYMSESVVEAIATLDKLCECFHVPFQSGDDSVLKRMRRGYTHERYMKIIDRIKSCAPDAAICGDVIVGFPGETDAQFQRTLELMEKVKFDNLNSYAYSPRPNTEAALWKDQVPEDIKSARLQMVQRLATTHAQERSERYLGREVEVLVEQQNPKNQNEVMGRNRQNKPVFFPGDINKLRGKLVHVRIDIARPWSLTGVQVSEPR